MRGQRLKRDEISRELTAVEKYILLHLNATLSDLRLDGVIKPSHMYWMRAKHLKAYRKGLLTHDQWIDEILLIVKTYRLGSKGKVYNNTKLDDKPVNKPSIWKRIWWGLQIIFNLK